MPLVMTNLHCMRGLFVVLFIIESCYGFYLLEMAPVDYCTRKNASDTCSNEIRVFVDRLNSYKSVVPFEYEHFDFCPPKENYSPTENLGQVVFGERIRPSAYLFDFGASGYGKACGKSYNEGDPNSKKKIDALIQAVKLNYHHHWIIDNMPVTSCYIAGYQKAICYPSFAVGCYVGKDLRGKDECHHLLPKDSLTADTAYLFNHVEIIIEYHRNEKDGTADGSGRLVKAQVSKLVSVAHSDSATIKEAVQSNKPLALTKDMPVNFSIDYTYQVYFKENQDVTWSSRWDYLLDSTHNAHIAWLSIMNSIVIVFFMSGIMAMITKRTIYRDSVWLNNSDNNKSGTIKRIFCSWNNNSNDLRWMLVQNDVFHPPCGGLLLSVFLGSGVQIICMTMITLVLASLGLLSPANRGALMTCVLVSFVCLGTPAGYVSSRIYKMFGGERRIANAILTACLCPGIVFAFTFILNVTFWSVGSSAAMSWIAILYLLALWFGVSVPLTFVGGYFGFKTRAIEHHLETSEIARTIPHGHLFTRPLIGVILGGILPFGCVFIQLIFILSSIWSHQLYCMFGFLFLVFVILVITCSETTMLLCYYHLRAEDYRWWWRSFVTGGFMAFYFFLYSIQYYVSKLEMEGFLNAFLYFGYTLVMTFIAFLLTGTIGFFACFWFVRKIYGSIDVDDGDSSEEHPQKDFVIKKEVPMTLVM